MEFTVKAISVLLKLVASNQIENEFGSELTGIFIDEVAEKGMDGINNFINEGKVKIEHILSKESMESMNIPEDNIDYIVAEIKELFSRIDITDKVFRQCKYNSKNLCAFLWDEYCKNKDGYVEYEIYIRQSLFVVAETLNKLIRESENFEKEAIIYISNSINDTNLELKKISDYIENGELEENYQTILGLLKIIIDQTQKTNTQKNNENTYIQDIKYQNNKKQEYIKIWNSRLFLHVDNDENPITLKEAFIMPDYKVHKEINRMRFCSDDTLDKIIEKFVKYDKTSTMLICGVPGIGKSTITSWLANKYKDDAKCIILRFRDWDNEELEKGLLKSICNTLVCKKIDLEDKILILDGFDEMKTLDIRENILNSFFDDIKDFDNIKCIITSRTGYIKFERFQNILKLQNFDINKTEEFCKKITGKGIDKKEKVESNLEVLGIPVILYMAIMSNIDISENPTKPELYNRIFSENGGIFDRFSDGDVEYASGKQILRNPQNIKKYLEFLCKTAFQMFEKNSLLLKRKECKIPTLEFQQKEISVLEFPIKHLFESVETNVEFIHKSIYEYFVSEYIFVSIRDAMNAEISKEKFAGILGEILKENIVSSEILEFLKFKIRHGELDDKLDIVLEIFQIMLYDGMTYYTNECCKNAIDCEMKIFANMLELLHLWEFGDILKFENSGSEYIRYNHKFQLNLSRADLRGADLNRADLSRAALRKAYLSRADLSRADLREADLNRADLRKADLSRADLRKTHLREAHLREAHLSRADLREAILNIADLSGADLSRTDLREAILNIADLSGADLSRADLREAHLRRANLEGANLEGANLEGANLNGAYLDEFNVEYLESKYDLSLTRVYISSTNEIITYEEYRKRKLD